MYLKAISEGEVRGGDVARGGTLVDPVDLLACLPLMFLDVFWYLVRCFKNSGGQPWPILSWILGYGVDITE